MIRASLNESAVDQATAEWLKTLGYSVLVGTEWASDRPRGHRESMSRAIKKLNPNLPDSIIDVVASLLSRQPHPTLIENNRHFHALLTDGVPVEYKDAKTGETRGGRARLIDFDNPANNDFLVVRQLTIQGPSGKTIRPDLILYVNGLPLVVIELKDPANASADLNMAIDQLGRYTETAPDLFVPNLLLVVSDGLLTRVGWRRTGRPWRSTGRCG